LIASWFLPAPPPFFLVIQKLWFAIKAYLVVMFRNKKLWRMGHEYQADLQDC
jgi:hypothetical protein